jgi:hypothetical protein
VGLHALRATSPVCSTTCGTCPRDRRSPRESAPRIDGIGPAVLEVDGRAFDPMWRLDSRRCRSHHRHTEQPISRRPRPSSVRAANADGSSATPSADTPADHGYLQRLAVDPDAQPKWHRRRARTSIASSGCDGRGVERGLGQYPRSQRARRFALYERLGFVPGRARARGLRLEIGTS